MNQAYLESFIDAIGWTIVHFLWQGAVVGIVLALLLRTCRHRYALLTMSMFSLFVLSIGTFSIQWANATKEMNLASPELSFVDEATSSAFPAKETNPNRESSQLEMNEAVANRDDGENRVGDRDAPHNGTTIPQSRNDRPLADGNPIETSRLADEVADVNDASSLAPEASSIESFWFASIVDIPAVEFILRVWRSWLFVIWMIGVAFFGCRFWIDWRAIQTLIRTASPLPNDSSIHQRISHLCDRIGLSRRVIILTSDSVMTPFVVGVLKPVVIAPVSMISNLPSHQVEAIMLHELAHVRRNDFAVNLFQSLMESLFFFHPVVWWISKQMRTEREFACDDIAASACDGIEHYAESLTALELTRKTRAVRLATSATGEAGKGELLTRIRRLVTRKEIDNPKIGWTVPMIGLIASLVIAASLTKSLNASNSGDDAEWHTLQTTQYVGGQQEVLFIHTDQTMEAVIVVELPDQVSSQSTSSGVQRLDRSSHFRAWANLEWNESVSRIRFRSDRPLLLTLNGQRFNLEEGRVFYWKTSGQIDQQSAFEESLPEPPEPIDDALGRHIVDVRMRATRDLSIVAQEDIPSEQAPLDPVEQEMTREPDPLTEDIEEATDPLESASSAVTAAREYHPVTVTGTVIDDETGEVIEQAVSIECGMYDPGDPNGSISWGYSKRTGGRRTGEFEATVDLSSGRTARVLVDGYLPKRLLTTPPSPEVDRIALTVRLTRGRAVSGRVLDHQGQPVVGASVFSVGHVTLNPRDGKAWGPLDGENHTFQPAQTDENGRFEELYLSDVNCVVVSSEDLDVWPVMIGDQQSTVEINLPQPATVVVDYDIEGAPETIDLYFQFTTPFEDREGAWKNVRYDHKITIERGQTVLTGLPPGRYQFMRQQLVQMESVGHYITMGRQRVEVNAGDEYQIAWTRPNGGAIVKANVSWPDDVEVEGIFYTLTRIGPDVDQQAEFPLVLDGGMIDLETGELNCALLPPGTYQLDIALQKPVSEERQMISSPIFPDYFHTLEITIPEGAEELVLDEIKLLVDALSENR